MNENKWISLAGNKCQGCGVQKDPKVFETYPYPEEERLCTNPITPLFSIDCQDYDFHGDWRIAVFCHECFHKLDPDMWISRRCWESLNPVVPFLELPLSPKD